MDKKPPEIYAEGGHEKTPEELAGNLARNTWTTFLKDYEGHIKSGNRGIVQTDLGATIDREIALIKKERGSEMATMVADRFIDEVKYCSQFIIESAEQLTKEAKEKYLKEDTAE